jgi:acyl carrier protein
MTPGNAAASAPHDSLPGFVRRVLAAVCGCEPAAFDDRTDLADLNLDSLALVTVLTQIEAVYDVDFSTADTLDALGARDLRELVAAIARIVARGRTS